MNERTGDIRNFASDIEALKAGYGIRLTKADVTALEAMTPNERLGWAEARAVTKHPDPNMTPPAPRRRWKQRVCQSR